MGSLSNYAENVLLNHVLKGAAYTQPIALYAALSTADPGESGAGIAEPVGLGYSRKLCNGWGAASGSGISNDTDIDFPLSSGDWGLIAYFAIYDAITGGNILAYGPIAISRRVQQGDLVSFYSGDFSVKWDSSCISTYLANALLDHLFKNSEYIQPSLLCVALSTANPLADGSGMAEPAGDNYSRVTCILWSVATAGISSNSADIVFPTASGDWGTISHTAILDAATSGNLLFFGAVDSSLQVDGDIATFASGVLVISLD